MCELRRTGRYRLRARAGFSCQVIHRNSASLHRADIIYFNQVNETVNQQVFPNQAIYTSLGSDLPTRQFGATATQTLFNGFQTANGARRAESQVAGARETLRVTEQLVLLDAATAYMYLLRVQAMLDLNRRNVEVLTEQLKQARDHFNAGEVTRTDVAQAESRSSDRNTRESTALLTMPRFWPFLLNENYTT